MDFLEQAKMLYRKRHVHAGTLSPNDLANLGLSITKLVRSSLTQQGGVSSFKYLPFISVIQKTVLTNRFQGNQAAMAFSELERYLLLLLAQPWKREFWLLKTYGGFFRTKVKAHLDSPEEILQLVGYMREGESSSRSCLVLDHPPDAEVVLNVAFDCQVAVEECLYIGEYYDKMKVVGLSLNDAMEVLLSGSSTDPVLPPYPMAAFQVKSNNNNVGGVISDVRKHKGAPRDVMMPALSTGQVAAPGMNSIHQVTGVPAAHPAPGLPPPLAPSFAPVSHPVLYPYQSPAEHHEGLGLKTDMQQQPAMPGGVAGNAGFLQAAGSRAAYTSSASAQSSGYSSGSVSSAPPSAYGVPSNFSASSVGYPNNSHHHPHTHPPMYNYASPGRALSCGDQVDSPPVVAQLPPSVSPRHSQQLPLPRRSPSDFPFMDDDDTGPACVFPEGTHEQHLQESFLNLQGGAGRGKGSNPAVMDMVRRDHGAGVRDGVAASFDCWPQMQKDMRSGGVGGTGSSVGHPSSGMVHRPAQQLSSDIVRCISAPSQPATAVTAFNTSLNASAMDDHQQKLAGRMQPPPTVMGNTVVVGSGENQTKNSSGHFQDNGALRYGDPQPVYYLPDSSQVPFQRYTNAAPGPVPQSKKPPPTFAQMAAGSGKSADNRALLSRQAQGSSSTATFTSQDKGQLPKSAVSSGRGGSGSSSEVILREKVLVKTGSLRGSSLVTPGSGQDQGFSRQASQSMDLGMLKWRCRTCTMENSTVETICAACSKSRNAPDLQFPAAGESKRICPACTFENQPGCMACEVCQNPLPDVHTYV